jgi:hypothetical protein
MLKAAARRLPGIRFEPRPAPLAEALPRMDVAAFVGFAASGPLHVPVAIEDPAQFSAIFGEAAPLAWDAASGDTVRARLAPAVAAFFANGGRRCWVVRVAGDDAADNYFPLPGVAVLRPQSERRLFPAFMRARSRGSWSDGFAVGAGFELLPLQPLAGYAGVGELVLSADSPKPANADLLWFSYCAGRYQMFAVAGALAQQAWFERVGLASPLPGESLTEARLYDTMDGRQPAARAVRARLAFPQGEPLLELEIAAREAPLAGALVSLAVDGDPAWLVVEQVAFVEAPRSPLEAIVQVRGALWRALAERPIDALELDRAAIVTLELRVQQGAQSLSTLRGLGLAPGHARYVNGLEPDEAFFARAKDVVRTLPFPLAGAQAPGALFLPLGLTSRPGAPLPALAQARTPLERDGLSGFDARLFLDPELADAAVPELMARADDIRYLRPEGKTRPLKGIHSILELDEVTLIAVPDAAQRGWQAALPAALPKAEDEKPAEPGTKGRFQDCDIRSVAPPELAAPAAGDEDGTFTLRWSSAERGHYVLQEATRAWADAHVIFEGEGQQITLYSRSPGHYFYRVSVRVGRNTSAWSRGVVVRVGADTRWELEPLADYRDDTLSAVQVALVRMCAARADLLAVLSLPLHYREDQAIAHAGRLRSFDRFEPRIHSYAALYHPWVVQRRDDGRLDEVPPEGIACGVLALRAAARGAWVAPANEPLRGLIALAPGAATEHWQALQQAQVNVVRQHPRGFLALAEDTLTDDADLRPINVRRLLILLRRLALRRGASYVFEPLTAAFRRMVERGFEEVLADLFRRGAFAGATPGSAYQVSAGTDVNPPHSLDQGRFVVELKVAPSLPLTFLSVRLVRSGERLAVAEGR